MWQSQYWCLKIVLHGSSLQRWGTSWDILERQYCCDWWLPSNRARQRNRKNDGTACKNTRYTVKPIQDTGCAPGPRLNTAITHLNPLDGSAKEVTVYLDDSPPSITCGFNHAPHVKRNNSVSTDGKTLYHRLGDSVGSRLKLNNAEFFYTVNVSTHGSAIVCCSAST